MIDRLPGLPVSYTALRCAEIINQHEIGISLQSLKTSLVEGGCPEKLLDDGYLSFLLDVLTSHSYINTDQGSFYLTEVGKHLLKFNPNLKTQKEASQPGFDLDLKKAYLTAKNPHTIRWDILGNLVFDF